MTYTDPTPGIPTADDNSPAARLAQIRQDYTDTGKRINDLINERTRLTDENKMANLVYRRQMSEELADELTAARTAHAQWGRMLPRGDTARGNGTQ